MSKNLLIGVTFYGLQNLDIHYDYEDLVKMEEQGRFPKQIMKHVWLLEQVLEWHRINIDRLPPKLD